MTKERKIMNFLELIEEKSKLGGYQGHHVQLLKDTLKDVVKECEYDDGTFSDEVIKIIQSNLEVVNES